MLPGQFRENERGPVVRVKILPTQSYLPEQLPQTVDTVFSAEMGERNPRPAFAPTQKRQLSVGATKDVVDQLTSLAFHANSTEQRAISTAIGLLTQPNSEGSTKQIDVKDTPNGNVIYIFNTGSPQNNPTVLTRNQSPSTKKKKLRRIVAHILDI